MRKNDRKARISEAIMDEYHKEMLRRTIEMYDEQENDERFKESDYYNKDLPGLPGFAIRKFVYSPDHINVSLFWPRYLCSANRLMGKSLLDMGTGTGVVAIYCALHGSPKKVVATDISRFAFENCQRNAKHYNLEEIGDPQFDTRLGSLFEPIGNEEKFDYIFWGFPWNCPEHTIEETLHDLGRTAPKEKIIQLSAGLDPGYKFLRQFIKESGRHLTPNGKVILGAGEFARHDVIKETAEENGYEIDVPLREKFSVIKSADWKLECIVYELTPRN